MVSSLQVLSSVPLGRRAVGKLIRVACTLLLLSTSVVGFNENDAVAIEVPSLDYPVIALQAGVSGSVTLDCSLDADGLVTSVEPVSGPPILVEAAAANARQWRFSQATKNDLGKRSVQLLYRFDIKGVTMSTPVSRSWWHAPYTVLVSAPRPKMMVRSQ
jgi:TonB family protein